MWFLRKVRVMGLSLGESISALTVFVQGLLSFFSPCVLPLLPIYIGYLAGGAAKTREDGTIEYPRRTVLVNTICFVIGVSFAFFLLGAGFTALGQFFSSYQQVFSIVAGVIMIAFGLYMLGAFGKNRFVETEHRLPFKLNKFAMNPGIALVLGFTFSFAWTPCIGPVLTSVLLMAGSSATATEGFLLVGVYTLGFILPFLAVGLFTGEVLRFFRTHGNVVKYTVKIGGALLLVMGLFTITGWMNGVSRFFASLGASTPTTEQVVSSEGDTSQASSESADVTTESSDSEASETDTASKSADQSSVDSEDTSRTTGDEAADSHSSAGDDASSASSQDEPADEEETDAQEDSRNYPVAPYADVEFTDQNGNKIALEDFRGKTILLNFFATWCGPCVQEMPDLQSLYEEYGENQEDLVVLGVANPSDDTPRAADETSEVIADFLKQKNVTYPVLMDTQGLLFGAYNISAFPTTIMITDDGLVFGQVVGGLTSEAMHTIVEQTMEGQR